ncbi:hypothetical protein [Streptomyces sp. SID8352]|uniref:hypothetical protein n=1 Tax=Streptomyces sp. SID8352 TaxID=2690338 RepID=UPI00136934D2|nr:hypothetical protein [Streptomyces sp. SID8352]MYU21817.1 hypothetical protein [Streptomyces sp. SID8352]
MSDEYGVYRDAIRGTWQDWWVAWPLSRRIALGDVLHGVRWRIRPAGTLTDRGVPFTARPGTPHNDYTYDAQGSATVRFKAVGTAAAGFSALADADAGALVTFRSTHGVLVVFQGLTETGVSDEPALAAELVRLGWEKWDDSYYAVSQVVTADTGAVLSAAGTDASAELRLRAAAGPAPVGLADLRGGVTLARASALGLKWTGLEPTPFFRVIRLRRDWLRRVGSDYGPPQPGRGAAPVPVPPLLLEEAWDDPAAVVEHAPAGEQPLSEHEK